MTSSSEGSRTNNSHVRLRAVIRARGNEPIEEVFVRLDGRPLAEDVSRLFHHDSFKNIVTLDCRVVVPPGEHELSVFARTSVSMSEPVSVRITRDTEVSDLLKPTLYILAVGVSDYQNPRLKLDYADKDAIGLVDALESASDDLFARIETKLLTNDKATRAAVTEGFEWLADSVTQHDLAFVMVSGHGVRDKRGKYYFVPHDFNREHISSTAARRLQRRWTHTFE